LPFTPQSSSKLGEERLLAEITTDVDAFLGDRHSYQARMSITFELLTSKLAKVCSGLKQFS